MADTRPHVPQNLLIPTIGVTCTESENEIDDGITGINQGEPVTIAGTLCDSIATYIGPALYTTKTGEEIPVPRIGSKVLVQTVGEGEWDANDPLTIGDGGYIPLAEPTDPIIALAAEAGEGGDKILATLCDVRYTAVDEEVGP